MLSTKPLSLLFIRHFLTAPSLIVLCLVAEPVIKIVAQVRLNTGPCQLPCSLDIISYSLKKGERHQATP